MVGCYDNSDLAVAIVKLFLCTRFREDYATECPVRPHTHPFWSYDHVQRETEQDDAATSQLRSTGGHLLP